MADEKKPLRQAEEIDLTPAEDDLLDHVWDALDAKWSAEEEQASHEQRPEKDNKTGSGR